jgi:hypothetical protein
MVFRSKKERHNGRDVRLRTVRAQAVHYFLQGFMCCSRERNQAAFGLRLLQCCGLIAQMAIVKKREHQTEFRLLLESGEPVALPPAEVSPAAVLVQFEKLRPYIPELIDELSAGTLAEPVAVMNDGSTFAIHGETRTFWVKLWHTSGSELAKIERVQVISCLPSTRGTNVIIGDES